MRLLPVCARCEAGEGGECHTPGCSFWMHDGPTEPLVYHGMTMSGECDSPWHDNPGLITPCPTCGGGAEAT